MRKFWLLFFVMVMAVCLVLGVTSIASAAENKTGCTIAAARDDSEAEYRIHLTGEGITDGSFDATKVKINDKTLAQWMAEKAIVQVYDTGLAGANLVRIDLPKYAENILKLDGTDTVTLLDGFKVGFDGTPQEGDYVQTLSELKIPTVDYGFAEEIDVFDGTITVDSGVLEFTPEFVAGYGTGVRNISVKLNGVALSPDENGKYTAEYGYGRSLLVFRAENAESPNAFVEKTITIEYADSVVEGPIYVSVASFDRNVTGRPTYADQLSLRFSNVIDAEAQANLTLRINGQDLSSMGTNVSLVWSADGRQVDVRTLFYQEGQTAASGIYRYDGTDEIEVGGVTAEVNTLKITSDGQVYNVTRGESEPEYLGEGYITVQRVAVERDHEGKQKDAIHIFFNENVDILGSAALTEGVLLFNTGTILINGYNLQAFWNANNGTTAYWVTSSNPYVRIDIFYANVPESMWNRNGENVVAVNASFITMTNLGLGQGFGDYTYDAIDGVVYEPGESPEEIDLNIAGIVVKKDIEAGNDWIQFIFEEDVWTQAQINIQNNTKITDNIVFNGKTLTEWKAMLGKCEIHAGADGANVLRITISSGNEHADLYNLLKLDGTDVVTVKAGFGLNRYQNVKEDQIVPGLDDVDAPVIAMESVTETQHEAEYEVKFTVTDASEYTVRVEHNGEPVAATNGKYIVTLVEGENTITVTVTDRSVFANVSTKTITVLYEARPVIEVSGIISGVTVKIPNQKITVSCDIGQITSVKLNGTAITGGADGAYAFTLAEGENTIVIAAKNGSATSEYSIRITLESGAPIIETSAKEETVTQAEYTFTVTADDAETIVVKVNGETVTAGSAGYTVTLAEGENTISVTATDAAGNIGTQSVTVTYTPEEDGGCKSNINAISFCGAILLIACAAIALRKKAK